MAIPALMVLAGEVARVRGFPQRLLAAVCLVSIAVGALQLARKSYRELRHALPTAIIATLVSVTVAIIPVEGSDSLTQAVLPILIMAAVAVWLPWTQPTPSPPVPGLSSLGAGEPAYHRLVIAALIVFIATTAIGHYAIVGNFVEQTDEATYWLQADWMRFKGFSWHVDPAIAEFFLDRHLVYRPGQIATQYPPGWPAVLALFQAIGLKQAWGIVLGALTILLTYRIGVLKANAQLGAFAAILLATSQWFANTHAGYMSHGAALFFIVAGAWAFLEGETRRGMSQSALWLLSGFLFSLSVATRPLTGLCMGAGLVLAAWWSHRESIGLRIRQTGLLVLGGLPGLAALLYYNSQTTGHPLQLGYSAAHGTMHAMGFGLRGFTVFETGIDRVARGDPFTLGDAANHFFSILSHVNLTWLAVTLAIPLVTALRLHRIRILPAYRLWLPLLLLPVVSFFYWGTYEVRMWIEVLPFFYLGVAALLIALWKKAPRLATALTLCAIVGQLSFVLAPRAENTYSDRPWSSYVKGYATRKNLEAIEELRAREGRLLIFAREPGKGFLPLFDRLMIYNGRGDDGDVLVARDLGARNDELMMRYPDRRVYLFERVGPYRPATITRLR